MARLILKNQFLGPKAAGYELELSARLGGLLGFPKEVFKAKPTDLDLYFFDIAYLDKRATYLAPLGEGYQSFDLDSPESYEANLLRAGEYINESRLDFLVNIYYWLPAYDLLNLCTTPCVANICTGSDLVHHEKISFQLYPQPEADFFIEGKYIYSGLTRNYF